MNIKEKIFKQYHIGHIWGRFAVAGTQIAIFVSGYTFLMVSANFYETANEFLEKSGMFLEFWQYMLIVAVPILIAYLFSWKFLVKSFYNSWADQFWSQSDKYIEKIADRVVEKLKDVGDNK